MPFRPTSVNDCITLNGLVHRPFNRIAFAAKEHKYGFVQRDGSVFANSDYFWSCSELAKRGRVTLDDAGRIPYKSKAFAATPAMLAGTKMHALIEHVIRECIRRNSGHMIPTEEALALAHAEDAHAAFFVQELTSFCDFFLMRPEQAFVACELLVGDARFLLSGSVDAVTVDTRSFRDFTIWDWKRSQQDVFAYHVQCMLYAQLFFNNFSDVCPRLPSASLLMLSETTVRQINVRANDPVKLTRANAFFRVHEAAREDALAEDDVAAKNTCMLIDIVHAKLDILLKIAQRLQTAWRRADYVDGSQPTKDALFEQLRHEHKLAKVVPSIHADRAPISGRDSPDLLAPRRDSPDLLAPRRLVDSPDLLAPRSRSRLRSRPPPPPGSDAHMMQEDARVAALSVHPAPQRPREPRRGAYDDNEDIRPLDEAPFLLLEDALTAAQNKMSELAWFLANR